MAKNPELDLIPIWRPSMSRARPPLVVSANGVHLRVWEVVRGNDPVGLCGGLVRESRATQLAETRWGHPLVCIADPVIGPL